MRAACRATARFPDPGPEVTSMVRTNAPSRRVLVVDADAAALDGLVGQISTVLARSGYPALDVLADDPSARVSGGRAPRSNPTDDTTHAGGMTAGDLVVCVDSRIA